MRRPNRMMMNCNGHNDDYWGDNDVDNDRRAVCRICSKCHNKPVTQRKRGCTPAADDVVLESVPYEVRRKKITLGPISKSILFLLF